ncbi:hypothetical protein ACFYO8_09740 [Micromonospora sp. NPDC005257]|uniref:hypothetical protein n=1 Tax=Micromonospora sp. NPDC005257 TaxID=3364230 RepID=UPI003689177F
MIFLLELALLGSVPGPAKLAVQAACFLAGGVLLTLAGHAAPAAASPLRRRSR